MHELLVRTGGAKDLTATVLENLARSGTHGASCPGDESRFAGFWLPNIAARKVGTEAGQPEDSQVGRGRGFGGVDLSHGLLDIWMLRGRFRA